MLKILFYTLFGKQRYFFRGNMILYFGRWPVAALCWHVKVLGTRGILSYRSGFILKGIYESGMHICATLLLSYQYDQPSAMIFLCSTSHIALLDRSYEYSLLISIHRRTAHHYFSIINYCYILWPD